MRDDHEVSLEKLIAIDQITEELWCKAIGDPEMGWKTLSVLEKQAWRNRARTEVAIRRKKVSQL